MCCIFQELLLFKEDIETTTPTQMAQWSDWEPLVAVDDESEFKSIQQRTCVDASNAPGNCTGDSEIVLQWFIFVPAMTNWDQCCNFNAYFEMFLFPLRKEKHSLCAVDDCLVTKLVARKSSTSEDLSTKYCPFKILKTTSFHFKIR